MRQGDIHAAPSGASGATKNEGMSSSCWNWGIEVNAGHVLAHWRRRRHAFAVATNASTSRCPTALSMSSMGRLRRGMLAKARCADCLLSCPGPVKAHYVISARRLCAAGWKMNNTCWTWQRKNTSFKRLLDDGASRGPGPAASSHRGHPMARWTSNEINPSCIHHAELARNGTASGIASGSDPRSERTCRTRARRAFNACRRYHSVDARKTNHLSIHSSYPSYPVIPSRHPIDGKTHYRGCC